MLIAPNSGTMLTGVTNAILDPLFIFGFDLQLRGAAIASFLARVTMLSYVLTVLRNHYLPTGFVHVGPEQFLKDVRELSKVAVPAILTNVATPIGGAFVTSQMARFGPEAVAGFAMVSRLQPVAFAVIFSLSGAIGPIIGQNYGAKIYSRVRGAYRAGIVFTLAYVVVASMVLYALHYPLARLFGAKPGSQAEKLVYMFCGPLALTWFFNGVIFVGNAACNNLKHPFVSTAINWSRHTIGVVPFVHLFSQTLGLEAVGVLVGRELGGCVFATVSFFVVSTLMNRLGPDAAVVMRPGSDSENPDHVSEQDEEHKVAENIHHEKHQHDFLSYFAANFGDGMVCSQHHHALGNRRFHNHRHHTPAWVASDYRDTDDATTPGREQAMTL